MEILKFKDSNESNNESVTKIIYPNFNEDYTPKISKIKTNLDYKHEKLDMQENALDMEVEHGMDDDKILEKYIDKMDQDRREQEQRLSQNIQLMEQRISEERRLSEERMEKRYLDVMKMLEKTNDNINNKTEDIYKNNEETKKWLIGLCITTILGIAAMVIAVVSVVGSKA